MTDAGRRVDARLVVPAVAAWAGAAGARGLLATSTSTAERFQQAAVIAGAAALLGIGVLVLAVALAGRRLRWSRPAFLPVAFTLLGVLAAGVSTLAATAPPVATWLDARATAVVRGVVVGEARALPPRRPGWGGEDEQEGRLATSAVTARGISV